MNRADNYCLAHALSLSCHRLSENPSEKIRFMPRNQDNDRFDMPPSAFDSAAASHNEAAAFGIARIGMLVPSRLQVRTLPIGELEFVLEYWMYESPAELIPSDDQIREVIFELMLRPDAESEDFKRLVDALNQYIGRT
ncbi:MAG: hypothetical protein E6Q76_04990 [Rhizobium sp.]|nr:MAG: hypothetical protein E6Q76_04990 [Rhizobium sp.]